MEKKMQNASTPQHPSENDCFAGDEVEDAEETDISLSSTNICMNGKTQEEVDKFKYLGSRQARGGTPGENKTIEYVRQRVNILAGRQEL